MATDSTGSTEEQRLQSAGVAIRQWRERFQLTQAELAERLGAAPSWVSQVERGKLHPSRKRMQLVAAALGVDAGELSQRDDEEPAADAVAYACLWRARADLLSKMGAAATSAAQRRRLDRLSRDLLRVAATHPKVSAYSTGDSLGSLAKIAKDAGPWVRWATAIELAGMKIDAPFDVGYDKGRRRELIELLLVDLALPAVAHALLVAVFESPPRKRPYWQDLHSVGGAFGGVLASQVANDDLLLLLAHDPVGWLGFDFAAGSWMVRAVVPPPVAEARTAAGAVAGSGVWAGGAAVGLGMGLIAGAVALGPILGAAAAAAAASRGASRSGGGRQSPSESLAEVVNTGRLAQSLGRKWVRVEASKLLALYVSLPDAQDILQQAGLPPLDGAKTHLERVAQYFDEAYVDEEVLSGTSDHDRNDRLREFADLRDSFRAVARRM